MIEYLQKLQNRCNGNPRLIEVYLYNYLFKSHDKNTIWKPRLSTLLYSANPKCNSHSVKRYIELSWKWLNIAMVIEPTVFMTPEPKDTPELPIHRNWSDNTTKALDYESLRIYQRMCQMSRFENESTKM